jgi:hypothetical protein
MTPASCDDALGKACQWLTRAAADALTTAQAALPVLGRGEFNAA